MVDNIISAYTREQAIEDGFLVDLTDLAKQVGFSTEVVVSAAVWETAIDKTERKEILAVEFQMAKNAMLLLRAAYQAILFKQQTEEKLIDPLFFRYDLELGRQKQKVELKIFFADALTIVMPDED